MTRKDKILHYIDSTGSGLELGPLCWPVLKKSGSNVKYVDHVSTAKLKQLYAKDQGVPAKQIVDIDFALEGHSLLETVGVKKFDFIIASHVIEHIPDTISWLHDTASVLNDGGKLSLAIPDRRFTFDIDREESDIADVIGAYLDRLEKPNSATVFDYISKYRNKVDATQAWNGQLYLDEKAGPHRYTHKDALAYSKRNKQDGKYVDTHCFVYTPYSFMRILKELIEFSLLDFKVTGFYDTSPNEYEFFVTLEKLKSPNKKIQLRSIPKLPHELSKRELQKAIRDYKNRVSYLDNEIENMKNSKSWRLTRPLRAVLSALNSIIRLGR